MFLPESFPLFLELPAESTLALAGTQILQEQTNNQMLKSFMVVISLHWQVDGNKSVPEKTSKH